MSSLASAPQSIADSCASDTSPHTLKTPLTSNSVRSHYWPWGLGRGDRCFSFEHERCPLLRPSHCYITIYSVVSRFAVWLIFQHKCAATSNSWTKSFSARDWSSNCWTGVLCSEFHVGWSTLGPNLLAIAHSGAIKFCPGRLRAPASEGCWLSGWSKVRYGVWGTWASYRRPELG